MLIHAGILAHCIRYLCESDEFIQPEPAVHGGPSHSGSPSPHMSMSPEEEVATPAPKQYAKPVRAKSDKKKRKLKKRPDEEPPAKTKSTGPRDRKSSSLSRTRRGASESRSKKPSSPLKQPDPPPKKWGRQREEQGKEELATTNKKKRPVEEDLDYAGGGGGGGVGGETAPTKKKKPSARKKEAKLEQEMDALEVQSMPDHFSGAGDDLSYGQNETLVGGAGAGYGWEYDALPMCCSVRGFGTCIFISADDATDLSVLDGLVQTLRGRVPIHPFVSEVFISAARRMYDQHTQYPVVRRMLQDAGYLLDEYVRRMALQGMPRGLPLGLLAQIVEKASNQACEMLQLDAGRELPFMHYRCCVAGVSEGVHMLMLYAAHHQASALIMSDAFRQLSPRLDMESQLTCVYIQQRLMELHRDTFTNMVAELLAQMRPESPVRDISDANLSVLEAAQLSDHCNRRAAALILQWHDANDSLQEVESAWRGLSASAGRDER